MDCPVEPSNYWALLVDVNIVILDHIAPAGDLALQELVTRSRRTHVLRERRHAGIRPHFQDGRIGHHIFKRSIEVIDDSGRGGARREQRLSILDFKLRPQ